MKSLEYVGVSPLQNDEHSERYGTTFTPRPTRLPYFVSSLRRWKWTVGVILAATILLIVLLYSASTDRSASGPNKLPTIVTTSPSSPQEPQHLPTNTTYCEAYFECKTDRLGHKSPLHAGEAICNHNYMMGLSKEGLFQWRDCATNETNIFYNKTGESLYYQMLPNATWTIRDRITGELQWKEDCLRDIAVHPQCLSRPRLDCPYIHLHKSGDIVLNYIDGKGHWFDRNARNKRIYKNLFP